MRSLETTNTVESTTEIDAQGPGYIFEAISTASTYEYSQDQIERAFRDMCFYNFELVSTCEGEPDLPLGRCTSRLKPL